MRGNSAGTRKGETLDCEHGKVPFYYSLCFKILRSLIMQNVSLQMAMTYKTFQSRRRRRVGVLLWSEDRSQKIRTAIRKRRNKEKTWRQFC